jgi:MoxR-like ATPase
MYQAIISAEEIQQAQALVRQVNINEDLVQYVSQIIRATRPILLPYLY